MIKINIKGGESNKDVEVVDDINTGKGALLVATNPAVTFENTVKYFANPNYGVEVNQNITLGGTTVGVHDGTDHAWWTAAALSGVWDFVSQAQKQNGSYSISGVSTTNASVARFAHATSQNLTGHTAIRGYIYITSWPSGDKQVQIYGWETTTPGIVGNVVNIGNYVNTGLLNSWQLFTIPLSAMGLTNKTINQIRIQTVGLGTQPKYYLDLINIIETGTPAEFKIEAEKSTWLHVHSLNIFIIDSFAATVASGTMPNIPYNSFLGAPGLAGGVVYQKHKSGKVEFSAIFRNTADLVEMPGTNIHSYGSDGGSSWLKMTVDLVEPVILKEEENDYLAFTLSEDLSGVSRFRIVAGCKTEQRGNK